MLITCKSAFLRVVFCLKSCGLFLCRVFVPQYLIIAVTWSTAYKAKNNFSSEQVVHNIRKKYILLALAHNIAPNGCKQTFTYRYNVFLVAKKSRYHNKCVAHKALLAYRRPLFNLDLDGHNHADKELVAVMATAYSIYVIVARLHNPGFIPRIIRE